MPTLPVVLDARVVTGTGGGPDKTILNSPRYLTLRGYRMLCAYMHPPGDIGYASLCAKAEKYHAPIYSVPDRGPWDWQVFTRLLYLCRHERVTIYHGHDYKSNLLGVLLAKLWPMRLVTTAHGWVKHTRRTPVYYHVDRLCLRHYERVIAVSPDLHAECRKWAGPARCELLENGIDLEEFTRKNATPTAQRQLGLPPGRHVIGAAGRLSPEKGFDVLLRSVAELVRRGVNAHLVLIGEGDEQANLERLATELGIRARCSLVGYQADLRPYYEAMDVFALSSLREGLPNVLLEALALEVPVVATKINGIPRLIRDGYNGHLVEPNQVAPLTDALHHCLDHPGHRQQLAAAGRQTVATGYSFAGRMDRLGHLYDRLLARR
jgi:glycosyltransferase involved in cell wall biosynthesis